MRHDPGSIREPLVHGYAVTHPPGTVVLPTAAGWNQLLFASSGVMTVETAAGTWVIPPHRALWVPDRSSYRVVMRGRVAIRTLYLSTDLAVPFEGWRAVNVSRLLRELIIHAVALAPLDLDRDVDLRLIGVLLDQFSTLAQEPLLLPRPLDERAHTIAATLSEQIDSRVGVDRLAHDAGSSRRNLERVFLAETGLTIGAWRQRNRLLRALELLAEGVPVTTVALAVGYSTPSAFTAMFHRQLGTTPSRYFADVVPVHSAITNDAAAELRRPTAARSGR